MFRLWTSLALKIVMLFAILVAGSAVIPATAPAQSGMPAANPKYADVKIKKFPVAVQCWTFRKFTFLETIEKAKELGVRYLQAYPGQKLGGEFGGVVFNHDLSESQIVALKKHLENTGMRVVAYGVVRFDNTEEAMRQVFGFAKKIGLQTIVTEPAYDDYSLIEKMVQEYNIQVAIHNHPPPTKYAQPGTVLNRIRGLDDRLGSCADTGHWLRTGVNPVDALRLLTGRIRDVHLKDLNIFGIKEAYDVPFGQGVANVHDILAELTLQDYQGYLAIEHENKDEIDNPSPSIRKGLEYIRSITYYRDYEQILAPRNGRYSKHGWNHYGPGYFELDEKSGVLHSQGGMGLLWYSAKKFKDFVLELDYKCESRQTNSGIFYRIPEWITSNDYIYHSFEIQIFDSGLDIHKTGSVYDAEPAQADAFNEPGVWNHMQITVRGDRVQVAVNGTEVVDWQMEPRGKIRDFAPEGYIGLQNHDSRATVRFKNIYVKEL